jgi:hypothetical protein
LEFSPGEKDEQGLRCIDVEREGARDRIPNPRLCHCHHQHLRRARVSPALHLGCDPCFPFPVRNQKTRQGSRGGEGKEEYVLGSYVRAADFFVLRRAGPLPTAPRAQPLLQAQGRRGRGARHSGYIWCIPSSFLSKVGQARQMTTVKPIRLPAVSIDRTVMKTRDVFERFSSPGTSLHQPVSNRYWKVMGENEGTLTQVPSGVAVFVGQPQSRSH